MQGRVQKREGTSDMQRHSVMTSRLMSVFAVLALGATAALAQSAPTAGPETAFRGCEDVQLAPAAVADPRDLMAGAPGGPIEVETTKKTRMLQGMPVDQAAADDEKNEACWARLDGVWQDDSVVIIDPAVEASGWAADLPSLQSLAHGTYTEPELMIVKSDTDHENVLVIVDAFDPSRQAVFISADDIPLSEVLKRGGKRKTYTARRDTGFGTELKVDVSRQGYVRLLVGDKLFSRPSPGLTARVNAVELGLTEVFVYQSNLDNVKASRRGYDITSQDGFDLLNNDKLEVFKEIFGNQYRILEKRTVPLGFNLVPEVKQGMIYSRNFLSSETEIQSSVADTYGGKARSGLAPGGVILAPSVSAGVDFSKSIAKSMRDAQSSSRAVGYSRTKLYAIVVDHPFIELSDNFIDAIEDARRYGGDDIRYYDRIIEKFGTHYPYAVTYGANAEMAFTSSEKSTFERKDSASSRRAEAEFEAVVASVSGYIGEAITSRRAESDITGSERATFQAVGGNGSWDQNGFAAGERPAPILLDLRPLDELLNPINFPGEPEVYGEVRTRLHKRIRDYTELRAAGLSDWPIYDTTPDGKYYTEAFPDLVFNFEEQSYVQSTLTVETVGGRTFGEYLTFQNLSDNPSLKSVSLPLSRTDDGSYKMIKHQKYEELFAAGAATQRDYQLYSLDGRLRGPVRLTALPEGPIILEINAGRDDAERIELQPWSEALDERLEAGALKGGWRSDAWPGFTVLAGERNADGTEIIFATEEGLPATLACVPDMLDTPKDRLDIANFSRLIFQGSDPLNGQHHLNVLQWSISGLFFSARDKDIPAEEMDDRKRAAQDILTCLFAEGTPLGSAPMLTVDDDPEALVRLMPALPRLEVQVDGSLSLTFWEPRNGDVKAEKAMRDLSETYWKPVGDAIALSPLPASEARALRRAYNDAIDDLRIEFKSSSTIVGKWYFTEEPTRINAFRMEGDDVLLVAAVTNDKAGDWLEYRRVDATTFKAVSSNARYYILPDGDILWKSNNNKNQEIRLRRLEKQ